MSTELEYEWQCIYCGADTVVLRVRTDAHLGPSVNEAACDCGTHGRYQYLPRTVPCWYVPAKEIEEY